MAMAQKHDIEISSDQPSKSSASLMHPLMEIEKAFDRLVGRGWPMTWHMRDFPAMDNLMEIEGARLPKLDVVDRAHEIIVRAEVPGLDKKDVHISLADNLLTIKGQTQHEKNEEKGDYHRHEIANTSFARCVTLPCAVAADKANASLKDGMLEIALPKTESSKKCCIKVH